jgi:murein DD-endopeptidase MepM/ murein hydrolase activator NlpD
MLLAAIKQRFTLAVMSVLFLTMLLPLDVLPSTAFARTASGSGSALTITTVFTTDGNGKVKSTFAPGDAIQYYARVNNSSGSTITATFHYQAWGPNNNFIYDQIYQNVPAPVGLITYPSPTTVPNNAPPGTYTIQVQVEDQNNTQNQDTKESQFNVVNILLTLPFPSETNMKVQQGWWYTVPLPPGCRGNSSLHCGIDYIDGTIDGSDWRHFAVLAAADGEACANCKTGPGNKVVIRHDLGNGVILYTYYGHLDWINPAIPSGDPNKTVHVTRGEEIGTAGNTGTTSVHLHFGLTPPDFSWVDPYDLYATRDKYPDPNGTNGLKSGPNNYWTANPPVYAPGFGTNLGGVDLVGYCKSLGYVGAGLFGTTAWNWACVDKSGNHIGINVTAACQWNYHRSDANSLWNDFYDPYSWRCYA